MVENQNIMLSYLLLLRHVPHDGESESNVNTSIATEEIIHMVENQNIMLTRLLLLRQNIYCYFTWWRISMRKSSIRTDLCLDVI